MKGKSFVVGVAMNDDMFGDGRSWREGQGGSGCGAPGADVCRAKSGPVIWEAGAHHRVELTMTSMTLDRLLPRIGAPAFATNWRRRR